MVKKLLIAFIVLLFGVSLFLRFYQLGSIPAGLNKDESGIGYNAYSILETGKDEHSVSYPLYFKSFNDNKLPVYIYLTAASEKVFGVTPFAVRLPSALFGIIAIISLFFLVKITSKRNDFAVASALFLAFNPWQFFFSRTGFEVNVATSLALLGSLFFTLAIKKKGNIWFLIISIFAFGLSLYAYNVTRLMAPILVLLLIAIHYKDIARWSVTTKITGIVLSFVTLLPFLIATLSMAKTVDQTSGLFLNGPFIKTQHMEFRSYLVLLPEVFTKLIFNSYLLVIWEYCKNLIHSFSIDFFFLAGPKTVNGVAGHGLFYIFELITLVIGFATAWKRREKFLLFFFLWFVLEVAVIAMTQEVPHPTRSFLQVIPLVVFSAYGAVSAWEYITKVKQLIFKRGLQILSIFVVSYAVLTYMVTYFFVFPINQAKIWRSQESELSKYLAANEGKYDAIIIDPKTDFSYTGLVFYTKFHPEIYHKNVSYKEDGLLLTAEKIGKYRFEKINWDKYPTSKKTLFVTDKDSAAGKAVLKEFSYPTRNIVLPENEKVISYPYAESAYILVESPKE